MKIQPFLGEKIVAHVEKEMISFYLTTKCNLNCSYCYINKKDRVHQTLDLEFAKAGINDYFQTDMRKHIRFYGAGEPTCEFKLMKKIRDYAYDIVGDDLSVELQTNGVFKKSAREWISKNVDLIWISLDGVPEIQDKNRRTIRNEPTSKMIEENIRFLIKNCSGSVGIRSTITDDNVSNQTDNISYLSSLGIKHIWSDPVFPGVGEEITTPLIDTMEYAKEFVKARKYADELGVFYGSILTCNFDKKTKYNCRACIPVPHLTTDGYVSACDMSLFGKIKDHMSIFIYGKWDKNKKIIRYDSKKINKLRSRSADNMPGCKKCIAKYHCAGYCLGEVTNETKDLFGQKTCVCEPIRYLLKHLTEEQKQYTYLHP